MWNTGLFHAMGKNAQIDVEVARCIASGGPHWYLGAGFRDSPPRCLLEIVKPCGLSGRQGTGEPAAVGATGSDQQTVGCGVCKRKR